MGNLTQKHRDVFDQLLLGRSHKEIARELGVSVTTVAQRIAAVREYYGGISRNDALICYAHDVSDRPQGRGLTIHIATKIAGARVPAPSDPSARYSYQRRIALLVVGFGSLLVALHVVCLIRHW